jgi:hypothetical protein
VRFSPIGAPLGATLCGGAMTLLALFTLSLPGSLIYPLAYAQVLIVLIALLFFASAVISWREARAVTQVEPARVPGGGGGAVMTATIVLCMVYAASWLVVGYFVATFAYVVAQLVLLGERRWWLVVTLAGGAVVLVYVVFDRLLLLPFPAGILFDTE